MAKKIMWIDLDGTVISLNSTPEFLSESLVDEGIQGGYDAFGVITHRGSYNSVLSILQYEEKIQPYERLAHVFTSKVVENFSKRTRLKCIGVSMVGDIAKFSLHMKTATSEELAQFQVPDYFTIYFGREYEKTIKPYENQVLFNRDERQQEFDRGDNKNAFTPRIKRFEFGLKMNILPDMQYSEYNHLTKNYQIIQALWYAKLHVFPNEEIIHHFFDDKIELCESSLLIPESCLPAGTTWNMFHHQAWEESSNRHKIAFKGQVKKQSLSTPLSDRPLCVKEQGTAVEVLTEQEDSLKCKSALTKPQRIEKSDGSHPLHEVIASILRSQDIFYEPVANFDPMFDKLKHVYRYFQIRSQEQWHSKFNFSARLKHFANYLSQVNQNKSPDLDSAENFKITSSVRLFRTQRYYDLWLDVPKTECQPTAQLFINFLSKNSIGCLVAKSLTNELQKLEKDKPSLDISTLSTPRNSLATARR